MSDKQTIKRRRVEFREMAGASTHAHLRGRAAGLSVLELILVVALAMIMGAMAIPMTRTAVATYQLDAAADSASGAIQGARYQAIMHGYPHQVDFNSATNQFQMLSEVPPATTFSNVGSSVPLSAQTVTMGVGTAGTGFTGHLILQFNPNGSVSAVSGQAMPAALTIAYNGTTKHLTVANYGTISISSTTP
jgi:Tfp pilus assembly protein FimT